jgi:hypothetical protein
MKPFDLEAAKRGEPVQLSSGSPVRFIGVMSDGRVVVEWSDKQLGHLPASNLRMAPVPRTIYVVTWWFEGKPRDDSCLWFHSKDRAEGYAATVKSNYGQPGNKWDHPVITPVEVSE